MSIEDLESIALAMVAPGKGIIAIDESTKTIAKRLRGAVGDREQRGKSPSLSRVAADHAGSRTSTSPARSCTTRRSARRPRTACRSPKVMKKAGIIPGIKVDKGTGGAGRVSRATWSPKGLDGLRRAPGGVRQAGCPVRQVARGDQHHRGQPQLHRDRGQLPRAGALCRAVPGSGPGADGRAGSASWMATTPSR